MDILKANRRGSREAEIEDSTGWKGVLRVHETKRRYKRNAKHKGSGKNPDLFLCPEVPLGQLGARKFFRKPDGNLAQI